MNATLPRPPARNLLRRIAALHGIQPSYLDESGIEREVPHESLLHFLRLFNVPVDDGSIRRALRDAERRSWTQFIPPTCVVRKRPRSFTWTVCIPLGKAPLSSLRFRVEIEDEHGRRRVIRVPTRAITLDAATTIERLRHVRLRCPFPHTLGLGYYAMDVTARARGRQWSGTTRLIVCPERCYSLDGKAASARWWGITLQLYGLRSHRNWGIGDFRDLRDAVAWAGRGLGAAFVGVSPLHALRRGMISPYSPSSRLFHHPLYLDLEGIEEFRDPTIQAAFGRRAFQRQLVTLRHTPTVDYDRVHALKQRVLEQCYRVFRRRHLASESPRGRAFLKFTYEQGERLERFATFQTLSRRFERAAGKYIPWREWPVDFQHPDARAVIRFRRRNRRQIDFHGYLEWQCQRQLKSVEVAARKAGMAIGLYKDMAVGIDPDGADAWAFQDQCVSGASIGAPPDLFWPLGQNWNLAPLHSERLMARGYQVFVDAFRSNMQSCGVLRIDHAMSVFRLFWIPEGTPPTAGGYIAYPAPDLLAIIALESVRNRVVVVGEDLGTITPEIRRSLADAGLLSYRLLPFEHTASGRFFRPSHYPKQAVVAVMTHDLPTLRGLWAGRDIAFKEQLGLYPDAESVATDRTRRQHQRGALLRALKLEGLLPSGYPLDPNGIPNLTDDLCRAIHHYMARTPSRLLAVSLEDLLGDLDTPNIPGVPPDRYPVWQIKAGPPGSDMRRWRRDPKIRAFAKNICRERNRRREATRGARRQAG